MVLKLDFKKAFDSISWPSLLKFLRHRGFPDHFCNWIEDPLSTGKTAVMLNGVPGSWVQCKNGLRQGDPISPYLFIIVADVLQQLILSAASDQANELHHPVFHDLPPSILQYADDTLIIAHASTTAARKLKQLLDDFALATGLCINFSKTTFVPMNVDDTTASSIAQIFGCTTSGFPQTYLGLPLSPTKLPPSAFQPLISSFRSFL
uniref:Reverse transcriptase domain-containing protein n=1 Tax=Triticum urartu TaxID=4572 RepID=A0A8R7QPU5_TRIUA